MKSSFNTAIARRALALGLVVFAGAAFAAPIQTSLYHSPGCMCCEYYADYLNAQGYDVKVRDTQDMAALNDKHGVPPRLSSCHTALLGGYVVVGHVPEPVIAKLLRETPDIRGIALPGMPSASPGMPGEKKGPFVIKSLSGDVYATY